MLTGSCSAPSPPQPRASLPVAMPAAARPAPPAPVAADWRDAPITPGLWHWRRIGGDSEAWFGEANPVVTFTCERMPHALAMRLAGAARGVRLTIATATMTRDLAAQPRAGGLIATLDPRDPLLDAVALSRGRFALGPAGGTPLILPAWPEVARVIDDCR